MLNNNKTNKFFHIDIKKLNHIYNDITINNNLKYYINSIDIINYNFINYIITNTKFTDIYVSKFFNKCKKFIKITINNICIYYYFKNKCNINKLIKVAIRSAVITKYFNINKPINIYIIPTLNKRFIPKNNIITPYHINGGFTNTSTNDIFIIRLEEFSKVILHEIIHHISNINNNIDFNNNDLNLLKKEFNIHKDLLLLPNEAIVELWATLFNSLFISFEYKKSFKKILNKEIEHSMILSYKILQKQNNQIWFEKTNTYCYIIFKTILLFNLNKLNDIYTFPYNSHNITKFLINYKNKTFNNNIKKYKNIDNNNSLKITYYGDM